MPNKPKKINRPWVPKRVSFKTSLDNQKFYNSTIWRSIAESFRQNNPTCKMCEEKGIVTASEVTDHIVSIRNGGSKFDEDNLQALCHKCHNSKSGKEGANARKYTIAKKPKY